MKAKKLAAVLLSGAMVVGSLAGCGAKENTTPEPAGEGTETTGTEAGSGETEVTAPVVEEGASLDFEDGKCGFVGNDTASVGGTKDSAIAVADYNGSKALQITPEGKSNVAFQMDALLGENAGKVASIDVTIGLKSDDGDFHAASGSLNVVSGGAQVQTQSWSVYLESANPRTFTLKVDDASVFADGGNFSVALLDDNQANDGGAFATYYIDNVVFRDADGKILSADTSAEYVQVATGKDISNLFMVENAQEVGQPNSGGGWGQADIFSDADMISAMQPGDVLEISYAAETGNLWIVLNGADAGWSRVGVGDCDGSGKEYAYYNNSRNIIQITYEQIAAVCGEDPSTWGGNIQAESDGAWEVFSVTYGQQGQYSAFAPAVTLEGSFSGGEWSQSGPDMTEDFLAALVPGTAIEVTYTSETGEIWLVFPDSAAGWTRVGVGDYDGSGNGYAICDGSTAYITYETIAEILGDDVSAWGGRVQLEASSSWEAYTVSVGTMSPLYANNHQVVIEGSFSGGEWSQDGPEMTEEFIAALVEGSVINVTYTSETGEIWLVFPDSAAGWTRVGVGDHDGSGNGYATCTGSYAQITFETIAEILGDDVSAWGGRVQLEASSSWEAYSVSVGQR